jgi:hypothetical protein
VIYLVFSQELGAPPHERLAAHGARFFATKLELLEQDETAVVVRLDCSRPALLAEFRITARAPTRDDLMNARDAETRGRAAGMAALAERCPRVWTLEPFGAEPSEAAWLTLAAICASVALGPVLPPDGSTLFGVRGSIERRDKALESAPPTASRT